MTAPALHFDRADVAEVHVLELLAKWAYSSDQFAELSTSWPQAEALCFDELANGVREAEIFVERYGGDPLQLASNVCLKAARENVQSLGTAILAMSSLADHELMKIARDGLAGVQWGQLTYGYSSWLRVRAGREATRGRALRSRGA